MSGVWNWIIFFAFLAVSIYVVVNIGNNLFKERFKQNRYIGFLRILIKKHEKGLLLKEDDFVSVLDPGVYWQYDPFDKYRVFNCDLSLPEFTGRYFDLILKNYPDVVEKHLTVADLKDNEVGLLYQDEKLKAILPPATKKGYWKGIVETRIDVINIEKEAGVPEKLVDALVHLPGSYESIIRIEVKDYETALLHINNEFIKQLESGLYAFWRHNRIVEVRHFDLRNLAVEISGQEIITKDKVTLRINLLANYILKDVLKIFKEVVDYKDFVYRELQFALRSVVGDNTLDELLSKKEEINTLVFDLAVKTISNAGIELKTVGIKDIILPGDMRDLMNQVVAAEKQAQANLIRRREEIAATRSLQNTSKMMENNPILIRLKELETLEKLTEKVDKISVFGGLDSLLNELIKLKQ